MSNKDITADIHLNRAPAKAEARAFRDDMRRLNKDLLDDATAGYRAETTEFRTAADARKQLAANAAEAEIRASRRAAESEMGDVRALKRARQEATAGVAAEFEKVGSSGSGGFGKVAAGAGVAVVVIKGVLEKVRELTDAFDRVGQKQKAIADKFTSDRDKLRELAAVEGRQADDKFTIDTHKFARNAGMRFDEAVAFRSNFANVGQQFKGTNISDDEYNQYQALSAANATRTAATPDAAAAFSGAFLTRNLKGFGAGSAEEAFRRQHQVASVYDAGEGSASQNFGAFAALKKEFESDPSLAAAFKSDTELATVGSLANAAGPDRQREQVAALVRNLRDPKNDKLQSLYGRLGVGNSASIQETVKALAPSLIAEARASGQGLDQVVGKYLPDAQGREALSVQINQGVLGGGYAQRAGVAAGAGKAGAGEQALKDFMGSKAGVERVADADAELARAERAAKDNDAYILRKQAVTNLTRAGRLDTNSAAFEDFTRGNFTFGLFGDKEQNRIDEEAQRLGLARGGDKVRREVDLSGDYDLTPEGRTSKLNAIARLTRGEGRDPFAAVPGEEARLEPERKGLLEQFNDVFSEQRFPERNGRALPRAADVRPWDGPGAQSWLGPDAPAGAGAGAKAGAAGGRDVVDLLTAQNGLLREQTEVLRKAVGGGAPPRPLIERPAGRSR